MDRSKKEFQLTGWHVLLMLVAFFGIIFLVNGIFIYYSQVTWTGLMPGNGYEASLKYNKEAAKARAILAKGWQTKVLVPKDGRIIIELKDRKGEPVTGLGAKGRALRAIGVKGDRDIVFRERGIGKYVLQGEGLAPGAWRIDVKFTRRGELQWRAQAEFAVPEK